MSLGSIIRQRREQLGMTQDQVAAQIGISKPYLSNVETSKAKNPPTDRILQGLESALGFISGELMRVAHLARTPVDVRQEHEMLEGEVNKLRSILKDLLADEPRTTKGDVDLDALYDKLSSEKSDSVQTIAAGVLVPIINKVSAGYPQHFTDLDYPPSVADEYMRCPDLHDPQAFATRVVGDSMEPDFCQGDIVIFSPNTPPRSGDDCFVRFEDGGETTFKRFYLDHDSAIRLQPLNSKYPSQTYDREQISGLWPAVFRHEKLRRD